MRYIATLSCISLRISRLPVRVSHRTDVMLVGTNVFVIVVGFAAMGRWLQSKCAKSLAMAGIGRGGAAPGLQTISPIPAVAESNASNSEKGDKAAAGLARLTAAGDRLRLNTISPIPAVAESKASNSKKGGGNVGKVSPPAATGDGLEMVDFRHVTVDVKGDSNSRASGNGRGRPSTLV